MADEAGQFDRSLNPDDVLRAIDDLPNHAFVTLNISGTITSWNAGAESLLGWPREQALRSHVSSLLGPGGAASGIGTQDLADVEAQGPSITRRWLKHLDGSVRPVRVTIAALRDDDAHLVGYIVVAHAEIVTPAANSHHEVARDIEDATPENMRRELAELRALLAAEVEDRTQSQAARARLLRRLVVAQEDERRRLARDLHDGLGQRLTALRLVLEENARRSSALGEPPASIGDALEMLAGIDHDVDFITWELRPAALDEVGLVRVMDTYVSEWSRQAGIRAEFHARTGNLQKFAPEVEASIYRIAQEGLNNVAKHARARSVNVLLELSGDILTLVVEDDGVGFGPMVKGETMIGLTGMRERAHAVGGTVEVEPTPGGGATLLARIPTRGFLDQFEADSDAGSSVDMDSATNHHGVGSVEGNAAALLTMRTRLAELQQAVGARDEFIATVAHELRNPIAPLALQVRLALNKTDQFVATGTPISIQWVQSQLRGVEQRLHRLLSTLDRLLDVSRLSTGRVDLEIESMNLTDVVREVIDAFNSELAVARCAITLSARGTPTGAWDRLRVEQIVGNLLSNAIRFGAGRPIEVAVDADHDFASVAIRDHGIGIAREQQSKIFERFERGIGQRAGGLGIGLWIVRNMCAAMGGHVSVDSTVGDGACFTVMFPRSSQSTKSSRHRSDFK